MYTLRGILRIGGNMTEQITEFYQGKSIRAYRILGCHRAEQGFRFMIWAPNARFVTVAGDFNGWSYTQNPAWRRQDGLWEAVIDNAQPYQKYKYVVTRSDGTVVMKADPYGRMVEPHGTASMVYDPDPYPWQDGGYLSGLGDVHTGPMNIYECHLGSWKEGLSYRQLADELLPYVQDMGYTHIEVMPLMAYPYDPSWGYQVTGYFAATSRYGSPDDLKYFVDQAHQRGIGVIMDWVPAHFTRDDHGLRLFDGTPCYEYGDPRRGDMRQWGTLLFDYGKPEVRSFLTSSAVYWLEEMHMDGLRVDAVSCMLYMDFGRENGDWLPNSQGGREDLSAIALFRHLSWAVHGLAGRKLLIAEESTAFPRVTDKQATAEEPGLGFDFKWNMGWMNDMLSYMAMDPIYRQYHHDKLTFSLTYAFSEHYVLAFSHDEVVHGKKSMLNKMPGTYEEKFQQLRLLYTYQMAHPGKKLTFMGMELGTFIEWRFYESLEWFLLSYPKHDEFRRFVRSLNRFYRDNPALYERDDGWDGFEWSVVDDKDTSVVAFLRKGRKETLLCVYNFTPVPRLGYRLPVPEAGSFSPVFSTGELPPEKNKPLVTRAVTGARFPYAIETDLFPFCGMYYKFTKNNDGKDVTQG